MFLLILKEYLLYSVFDGHGGRSDYKYHDWITWAAGALVVAWVAWLLIRRYLRVRRLRRPSRPDQRKSLNRVDRIKRQLSAQYLGLGFGGNVHAVGVGLLNTGEPCIQIFVQDAAAELSPGSGGLPERYRGIPLVLLEMPAAGFLSETGVGSSVLGAQYPQGIRDHQPVIVGGISGANTNLSGESGTIGYFCTRRSVLRRRQKPIHLLSNSHVFADLRKDRADEQDLIMQPSPGEPSSNRPIATLVNFSPLKFTGDTKQPNYVDAAIAKLWDPASHQPLIPLIGTVKGTVRKPDIAPGEAVRKFGRTTGYTEGRVLSTHLDIWIRYDRTGQSAFFHDQILIEPSSSEFTKFVAKGDSGSLVVDAEQRALGLIFAGVSVLPIATDRAQQVAPVAGTTPVPRVEGYGVANPISEVLDRLKIDLLI